MPQLKQTLSRSYTARPESVAFAREDMAAFAVGCGASRARADQVRLAVSEAVTNAIRHGYRDGDGEVEVSASQWDQSLTIVVRDDGIGIGGGPEPGSRPGLGLGLGIVAHLTDHMALVPRPEGGVELQMRFALAPAESGFGGGGGSARGRVQRGDRARLSDRVFAAE